MGEIRFVGTGETRGYPYPVCKKEHGLCAYTVDNPLAKARGLSLRTCAQSMLYLSLILSWNSVRNCKNKKGKMILDLNQWQDFCRELVINGGTSIYSTSDIPKSKYPNYLNFKLNFLVPENLL